MIWQDYNLKNIRYDQPKLSQSNHPHRKLMRAQKKTTNDQHLHQKPPPRQRKYPLSNSDKMNIGNTPNRIGSKTSLSPLRSRRTESSLMARSNFSRKRDFMCINDPHKVAKYLAYSEEESLYYCEKCAILLASQGFTVMKLSGA